MNRLIKILLLAFGLMLNLAVSGQNIFQKRSGLHYYYDQFTSVFPSDTGFLALGDAILAHTQDSMTNLLTTRRLTMTWYNWNGDTIKHRYFIKYLTDYFAMSPNNNTQYSNGFYHFGGFRDTLNTSQSNTSDIFISKFNYNGDTIWSRRYDSGFWDNGVAGVVAGNGDFIGIGNSQVASQKVFGRAIRYDSVGNVIWNKTYNNIYGNYPQYIIKGDSGHLYISGYAAINNNGGGNPKNYRTMLLKIDSLGNQIWMKYLPGICDDYSGGIAFAQDGNILMAQCKCHEQPAGSANLSRFALYKLNKDSGNTIWYKEYPTQYYESINYPNFIESLSNGNVILGGKGLKLFIQGADTLYGKEMGALVQTDSMGNMLWQRYYYSNEADINHLYFSDLTDGKPAPDGGLILVGRVTGYDSNSNLFQDGWLIKTDANGCIDASCVNDIDELEEDDFNLFIYPNPANDYVSIDLPVTHNKATLQIINMQGQLVKTTAINGGGLQRIDTSDLAGGVYQLVVSTPNKVLGTEKLVVVR